MNFLLALRLLLAVVYRAIFDKQCRRRGKYRHELERLSLGEGSGIWGK